MAFPNSIEFAFVTETSITASATYTTNRVTLFATPSSVTGVCVCVCVCVCVRVCVCVDESRSAGEF